MSIKRIWIFLILFLSSASDSQTIIFTETYYSPLFEPFDYCFPQSSVERNQNNQGSSILIAHHVLINEEDQATATDIYVAGEFSNDPGRLWFYSGQRWWDENVHDFAGYRRVKRGERPLVKVVIEYDPEDYRFSGGGKIWVGYGNRQEFVNNWWDMQIAVESYEDMISRENYELLWEIQPEQVPLGGELHVESSYLCLEATRLKSTTIRD